MIAGRQRSRQEVVDAQYAVYALSELCTPPCRVPQVEKGGTYERSKPSWRVIALQVYDDKGLRQRQLTRFTALKAARPE